MIVKMKKVTLAALTSTISHTIEALRHLGDIHVDPVKQPESTEIEGLRDEIETLEKALNTLVARRGTVKEKYSQSIRASIETAKQCLSLLDQKNQFEDRLKTVEEEVERLGPLGDFSPDDIEYLKALFRDYHYLIVPINLGSRLRRQIEPLFTKMYYTNIFNNKIIAFNKDKAIYGFIINV